MNSTVLRRSTTASTLLSALLIIASAISIHAATPYAVTFDSDMFIGGPGPNTGTFWRTSGSDLICASGTVEDTRYVWGTHFTGRGGNPNGVPLQVDKTMHCPTGDIYIRLEIKGVFVAETFVWTILGGNGSYAGLHGGGSGTTDYPGTNGVPDGHVLNHYSGYLNQ